MKRVLMLLLAASLLFAGCLDAIGMGDEDDVIDIGVIDDGLTAMSGAEVEAMLNDEAVTNITALAAGEEKFRVEIYSKELEDGQVAEMTFIIGKDESTQLAETGVNVQSGMMGLEYTMIQGASTDVNIKVGNQWFLARDEVPQYLDPFVDMMDDSDAPGDGGGEAEDDPFSDMEPDFDDFDFDFTGMNWTVTIDSVSLQQVATASNETHSVMVEFLDSPPRLHDIQIDSHDGNEAMALTLVWGEEAALSLSNTYPRTSVDLTFDEEQNYNEPEGEYTCANNNTVQWSYVNDEWDDCGDNSDEGVDPSTIPQSTTEYVGEIDDEQVHEVMTGDIELRVGVAETDESGEEVFNYSVSMNLADGTANLTDAGGAYWDIVWTDSNGDGFVSEGDKYTVTTNSSSYDMEIRFWDDWSQSYEGGPLPGFELFLLLGALALAALRRNFTL